MSQSRTPLPVTQGGEDRREFLKQVGRAAWAAPVILSLDKRHAGASSMAVQGDSGWAPTRRCANGDFETGTFDGWKAYRGGVSSGTAGSWQEGIEPSRHKITELGFGVDDVVGSISQVGEGAYAAKLGNKMAGAQADMLAYTFVVTNANQSFGFRYALVLENPEKHTPSEQPFFNYYVVPGLSALYPAGVTPIVDEKVIADASNPFFKSILANGETIVYRDWTPVCLDLSAHLGQTLTIAFVVADCGPTAHFGYAYIDGLCRSNAATPVFEMPRHWCPGTDLVVDASASTNETSFFWSIEESDADYGRKPETEISEWTVGEQAAVKNLTALYKAKTGHDLECDKYYRVKLAVTNDCTAWSETVQLLHVTCPSATGGPDRCVGCRPSDAVTQLGVGNASDPQLTYVWTPPDGLDDPSKASPLHLHGSVAYPATYTVVVTDETGCSGTDQVTLYCRPPTLEVCLERRDCCSATLIAAVAGEKSIVWSTGQEGTYSIEVAAPGTYTVTASNPCGTVSESITVPVSVGMTGYPSPVTVNAQFCPSSPSPSCKGKLYFVDPAGGPEGTPGAYNATEYKLDIFDAAGGLVWRKEAMSCNGFPNWHVAWDGLDLAGNLAPPGVYTWRLRFKNCEHPRWTKPRVRRLVERRCVRWKVVLGFRKCVQYNVPWGTTEDIIAGTGTLQLK